MVETRDAGHHHLEVSYDNIVADISISTIIIIIITIIITIIIIITILHHHHHHQHHSYINSIINTIPHRHHHHHQSYVAITIMIRYDEYLAMKVVRGTSASV